MADELFRYLRQWNLKEPERIATTATSTVYKTKGTDGPAILKILSTLGATDEGKGALALEYYAGLGAVNLLQAEEGAHLLEFASGENLLSLVQSGKDAEATGIICSVLSGLHKERAAPLPKQLFPLERWFQSLFSKAMLPDCPSTFHDAAVIARELLATQTNIKVLHGDIHHENILLSPARGWLAIDPKGILGEATFDVANVFYNPEAFPELIREKRRIEATAKIFSERLGFEYERVLRFAYAYGLLSASWMEEERKDAGPRLEIASRIRQFF